jgi:hypothetical protein
MLVAGGNRTLEWMDKVTLKRVSIPWRASWILVCAAIWMILLPSGVARAQPEATRYFEETGHNVSGEFLRFYEANGERAIFGYPITREFSERGLQVQYFQRARLELYPESSESERIQLGALGRELDYGQPPLSTDEVQSLSHPDRRYYPETGHTVAFAFLEFYEGNGGAALFGYPISEWTIELNGRIGQYFERIKLEWYPENPPGQRVQPGMLGVIYVEQYVDPVHTEREDPRIIDTTSASPPDDPSEPPPLPSAVTELQLLTSVKHPIIGLDDMQTVYVYVLDQMGQGVAGASVEVEVQYTGGRADRFSVDETNANGYGQISFPVIGSRPGYVVIVNLHAAYEKLEARANSAFLPWW